jgi:hypothetical protein
MAKTDRQAASAQVAGDARGKWLYWGLAVVVLVLGFADLARGGETIAPILLVLGYCVLIPLAILR